MIENATFLNKRFPNFGQSWGAGLQPLGYYKILNHPAFVTNFQKVYGLNNKPIPSQLGNEFKLKIDEYYKKVQAFNQAKNGIRIIKDKAYRQKFDSKVNLYQIMGQFHKSTIEEVQAELTLRLEKLSKIEITNSKNPPTIQGHRLVINEPVTEKELDKLKKQHDDILAFRANLSKLITKTKRDYTKEAKKTQTQKALDAAKADKAVKFEMINSILSDKDIKTKLIEELKKELNAKPKTASSG